MIDKKIDSFVTTSNGTNTHTYTGNELGKKIFVAKTSNIESNVKEVWDTIWHSETEYTSIETENTSTESLSIPIGSTTFVLEFDFTPNSNISEAWISLGEDGVNKIIVGLAYHQSNSQGIDVMSVSEYIDFIYDSTPVNVGELVHIKFTYKNGFMTYSDGDETLSITNAVITPEKILDIGVRDATLSNMKLYPI